MLQIILINYGFLYLTERTYRLKKILFKKHHDDNSDVLYFMKRFLASGLNK